MPRDNISSNTGNAPIVRQGHTASTKHGSDPNVKVKGSTTTRDLNIK